MLKVCSSRAAVTETFCGWMETKSRSCQNRLHLWGIQLEENSFLFWTLSSSGNLKFWMALVSCHRNIHKIAIFLDLAHRVCSEWFNFKEPMLQTVIHAWMNAGMSNRSTVQIKSPGTIYSSRPKPTVKTSHIMEKRRNFHPSIKLLVTEHKCN